MGRQALALALFRLLVPGAALACVTLALTLPLPLTAALAVACWGPGWLLALALMLRFGRRGLAPALRDAAAIVEARRWAAEARPFFFYRISLVVLSQSPLIAMAVLQAPATAIGAYAAASSTVALAAVLATATNRAYAQRLSLLLERSDHAGLLQLKRERRRWMLPTLAVFLLACFALGEPILALFRAEFVHEGSAALRILAIGTATSVFLSLAPTYLKYLRLRRLTYTTVGGAALVQAALLLLLVPSLGAAGAALASATSIGGMYVVFAWLAHRDLAGQSDK
jgi:O-antigen/teichoic acid export membrane protein